jgi:hypothetical protein
VVAKDLGNTTGLALDDAGHAYVGDNGGSESVQEVTLADGSSRALAQGDLTGTWGVATDGTGNVYAVDDHHVWRINEGGISPGHGKTPPPVNGGKLTVRQVEGVTAVPGKNAVPKVTVTNSTDLHVGKQDVTLTLGPGGLKWLGFHNLYSSRYGGKQSFPCEIDESNPKQAVCRNVDLNLDPGQTVELRTVVGTFSSLKPCEVPRVHFAVGDLGSADANFVMKDADGNPDHCPTDQ